jgi:hypothetical protein
MAFFSEIKARLGLDITPFEKGLSQAQGSLGKVVGGAAGKLGNFKAIGTTIATALGLNLESIAENVARAVVGFSKNQEDALLKLVDSSEAAANRMAKILLKRQGGDDPKRRIELLDKELESVRKQAEAITTLTEKEKQSIRSKNALSNELVPGSAEIERQETEMAKNVATARARITQIRLEKLEAEDEVRDNANKTQKEDLANSVKAAEQFKKSEQIKEEARKKTLTIDEKIKEEEAAIVQAQKDQDDTSKTAAQRLDAITAKEQARANLADLLVDKKKQEQAVEEELLSFFGDVEKSRADAEQARTDKLKDQLKTLEDQKKTIEQTLAAQAKASLLPSMADVVSGKRNIGGVARARATQLERDRASARDLADAEQRARETLASASGPFATADALKSGRAIRAQLDETRSRITTNENLLGSRISDANPNAEMEKQLIEIKTELKTLNNVTFAPQNTTK